MVDALEMLDLRFDKIEKDFERFENAVIGTDLQQITIPYPGEDSPGRPNL